MEEYTPEEVQNALKKIEEMDHYTMCRMWRFAGEGTDIYFRSDLLTGKAFTERLFTHFGGFNPQISKQIGW